MIEPNTQTPSCSILIVDDDAPLLKVYQKILSIEGHKAIGMASREEALEWLKNNSAPSLLLLDCRMPGISNEDFVGEVKKIQHERLTTRIIGFSCFSPKSQFALEMKQVLGEFIEKPNDILKFLSTINGICAEAKS